MQNQRKLFRAGEFARLCGVSKHTLFHYDDIGVVRPAFVASNGYRYYSMQQFLAMDIVAVLQETGMSLREIKAYMAARDPQCLLTLLEEKQESLAREQAKLARMRQLLQQTAARTREGLQAVCGAPRMEECLEEYLIVTPVYGTDDRAQMEACTDHLEYCHAHGFDEQAPLGVMMRQETLLSGGDSVADFYFSQLPRRRKCSRLHIRPAGLYAVLDFQGAYDEVGPQGYRLLWDYLRTRQYQIAGNAYEQDLISYLATGDETRYIVRIAIPVKKEG